jgi:hypothetical protein
MLSVKPGQIWERRAMSGAPWRPVRVENVVADEVELRYLDMPNVPELQQVFTTSLTRMFASEANLGPEYRYASES